MSQEYIGKFSEIGFALEDIRGTAESAPTKSAKKIEANFYKNVEKAEDESVVATVMDINKLRKTQEWYEGDVSMNLHADTIGYLLANIFGDVESAEEGGGYKHTFTQDEAIKRQSFTTFVKEGDVKQEKIAGTVVSTLSLSAEQDGYVSADIGLIGRSGEADTATFSYDKEYDFIGKDITITIGDSKAQLDNGGTEIDVKSLTLDIDTGAEADFVSEGEYTPHEIFQGNTNISGSLELNYDGNTLYDLYNSDTAKYMRIEIKDDHDLGTNTNPTVQIDLHKVFVEDWSRSGGQDEVVTQDVTFRATYNEDEATDPIWKAEVINSTDEYISES